MITSRRFDGRVVWILQGARFLNWFNYGAWEDHPFNTISYAIFEDVDEVIDQYIARFPDYNVSYWGKEILLVIRVDDSGLFYAQRIAAIDLDMLPPRYVMGDGTVDVDWGARKRFSSIREAILFLHQWFQQ